MTFGHQINKEILNKNNDTRDVNDRLFQASNITIKNKRRKEENTNRLYQILANTPKISQESIKLIHERIRKDVFRAFFTLNVQQPSFGKGQYKFHYVKKELLHGQQKQSMSMNRNYNKKEKEKLPSSIYTQNDYVYLSDAVNQVISYDDAQKVYEELMLNKYIVDVREINTLCFPMHNKQSKIYEKEEKEANIMYKEEVVHVPKFLTSCYKGCKYSDVYDISKYRYSSFGLNNTITFPRMETSDNSCRTNFMIKNQNQKSSDNEKQEIMKQNSLTSDKVSSLNKSLSLLKQKVESRKGEAEGKGNSQDVSTGNGSKETEKDHQDQSSNVKLKDENVVTIPPEKGNKNDQNDNFEDDEEEEVQNENNESEVQVDKPIIINHVKKINDTKKVGPSEIGAFLSRQNSYEKARQSSLEATKIRYDKEKELEDIVDQLLREKKLMQTFHRKKTKKTKTDSHSASELTPWQRPSSDSSIQATMKNLTEEEKTTILMFDEQSLQIRNHASRMEKATRLKIEKQLQREEDLQRASPPLIYSDQTWNKSREKTDKGVTMTMPFSFASTCGHYKTYGEEKPTAALDIISEEEKLPSILINVDLGGGKSTVLALKDENNIDSMVNNFAKIYSLKDDKVALLRHKCHEIWSQYNPIDGA